MCHENDVFASSPIALNLLYNRAAGSTAGNLDWKNSLTTRFEYKRSRTVGLNMANTQVNEVNTAEFILGAGYRFNQVPLVKK